ncbi:complex I subunit 4 family protein [Sulfurovum sp. NBC37-1]|uniref:complex I subunit 4 family protein n=1 Tax=Sulfurovum sp. (strain NBC37-1) TaxID=387093 RepID=UPI0001587563|nr:NADH-quinone oxidoreductase subunit M [Sulfurovum sp. NBC37-1]BAF71810.1 NADH-quinone oxidoreductase, chain M [Sulfurovum sp. NBC37-1]
MSPLLFVFGPIILGSLMMLLGKKESGMAKYIALTLFAIMLFFSFALLSALPEEGYMDLGSWFAVRDFDFILSLQVDRLSVVMLILTSALLILVTLSSWTMKDPRNYFSLLVLFSGPIFGVFMSTNLLWFFIFWELTLVPMFFLVGIWGAEGRIYAAVKFFLYTHVASMLILLAFFLIYKETGIFDMTMVKEAMLSTPVLVWWLLFIGFAVKMPIFPFHTWLPDAHVQAPAPVSALLAGVLLKMGAYAMIRMVVLMLPEQSEHFAWVILVLGLVTLFYAGFMALYETHLKKMVAYSSISHMGLVTVAIATLSYAGLSAALYEMIGHALIISPLFLIAGFLHSRTGSWQMKDMGGLMQKAPYLSAIFVLAGLAALGLPGTMGFIGELTILIAAIEQYGIGLIVVALGSMIGAGYIIWTFRRVVYGEKSALVEKSDFRMNRVEFAALIIFALGIIGFGLFPSVLFDTINAAFSMLLTSGGAL